MICQYREECIVDVCLFVSVINNISDSCIIILPYGLFLPQNKKYSKVAAILSGTGALCIVINNFIPAPEIYKVSESGNYTGEIWVEICYDHKWFDTYYSIDGSNPENGEKYEGPFSISVPTKIYAKSKFLFWWSELAENSFGYQNLMTDDYKNEKDIPEEADKTKSSELETETDEPETTTEDSLIDQTIESEAIVEGQNASEGYALLTYINQYRIDAGLGELVWDYDLEQIAQNIAQIFASGDYIMGKEQYILIGRQCNGAKSAKRAIDDWISGNKYIPSESDKLLNEDITKMGGVLYYLPNGNEYGYHYFWIICLK